MQLKNTQLRYGVVGVVFHWLMAVLVIGMLAVGIYMVDLPKSPDKFQLYGWHKATGFIVLTLAVLRLCWRFYNVNPQLDLPWLEKMAARSMHLFLFLCLFAMPLTGWLLTSAAGYPASFFGLFTIPNLMAPNDAFRHTFQLMHSYLGYTLIAAIIVHTLAALKHHFIDKDDIFRRML